MASTICFTFTRNWKVSVCESQASFGSGSDWISQGSFRRRPLFVCLRQIPLRDENLRYVYMSAEAFSSQVILKYTGFLLGLNDLLLVKFIS
jgi:hypothetical protein